IGPHRVCKQHVTGGQLPLRQTKGRVTLFTNKVEPRPEPVALCCHAGGPRMKTILKVAVILSSVLLVSGFLAYRAGAFNTLFGPSMMSSSKSGPAFAPGPPTAPDGLPLPTATQVDPTIMSSSKSIAPLIPPSGSSTQVPGQKGITIMPGSKAGAVV